MKFRNYLLALGLLTLVSCSGSGTSSTSEISGSESSTSESSGSESSSSETSSTDEYATEKAELIAYIQSLATSSFTITRGEEVVIVTDNYLSNGSSGVILLDAYAGETDKIAYPFTLVEGEVTLGLALTDSDGEPVSSLREGYPAFASASVDDIASYSNGSATITENSVTYGLFARGYSVSGALTLTLSDGSLSVSYASGEASVISAVGTSSDTVLETFLDEKNTPMQGVDYIAGLNIVYGNYYNAVANLYEVVDGVKGTTPVSTYSIVESPDLVLTVDTDNAPISAIARREDGNAYKATPVTDESGAITSFEYTAITDESGNAVSWSEVALTSTHFDLGGFRRVSQTAADSEAGTLAVGHYHYFGWLEEQCYEAAAYESLPTGYTIADLDLDVTGEAGSAYVSNVSFTTDTQTVESTEEGGASYELGYVLDITVVQEPEIYTLDMFITSAE